MRFSAWVGFTLCSGVLALSASQGCGSDTIIAAGGGGSVPATGGGGSVGTGDRVFYTCGECVDPVEGAVFDACSAQAEACEADPDCVALNECVVHGYPPVGTGGGAQSSATTGAGG